MGVHLGVNEVGVPDHLAAWLPAVRVARAWQALVTDRPFNH